MEQQSIVQCPIISLTPHWKNNYNIWKNIFRLARFMDDHFLHQEKNDLQGSSWLQKLIICVFYKVWKINYHWWFWHTSWFHTKHSWQTCWYSLKSSLLITHLPEFYRICGLEKFTVQVLIRIHFWCLVYESYKNSKNKKYLEVMKLSDHE